MNKALDRAFALEAVRVTEAAARAAARYVGRGDEHAAEEAAASAMREAFSHLPINGRVVLGEGESEDVPILFSGEIVGSGGVSVDLALDPLEGSTPTAKSLPNALSVLVIAEPDTLLAVPDLYMDKIAIGPGYPPGLVDLDRDPAENVAALARAKNVPTCDITVCILDRPRHSQILERTRSSGAAIKLIDDGDVAAIIATCDPQSGIDLYLGSGGARAGILAAAALRCVGGQMQTRLVIRSEEERICAAQFGLNDGRRKFALTDLVGGDVIFAATGVTDGVLLSGIKRVNGYSLTQSVVMRAASGTARYVRARHRVSDGL
jgi:fructose-1,6-bisphosphatase II / sedoheptulose-1,7-bisphosphatase